MTVRNKTWEVWLLEPDHWNLELHEDVTAGIGVELDVWTGAGVAKTYGAWRLSNTGAVLAWVVAGDV